MINQILRNLQDCLDLDDEKLNKIKEQIQEFGYSCYEFGYREGMDQRSEDIEKYYGGFGYGKKSDNE